MLCVKVLLWYVTHNRNYGILATPARAIFKTCLDPPCTKVFGTHSFHEGGGLISKTVDPTNFNFGRPLGLSMRGKKLVELMI